MPCSHDADAASAVARGSTSWALNTVCWPAGTTAAAAPASRGWISTAPSNTATRMLALSSRTMKRVPNARIVPCDVRTMKGRWTGDGSRPVVSRISPARSHSTRCSGV
ncbi:hypothetical protein G6F68_019336 [Rhizopus microsporus]|nr:hypothetical protein G6F68_019336 [Rhizopus microsporus]